MMKRNHLNIFAALLLTAAGSMAQPSPAKQAEDTRKNLDQLKFMRYDQNQLAPELYPGENEDVGPQHMLRLKQRHQYFRAFVDSQYYFTSNARLSAQPDPSTVFINTIQAEFTPKPFKLLDKEF